MQDYASSDASEKATDRPEASTLTSPGLNGETGSAEERADALAKELAKWQARVPKLAAALKQRTQEVEQLKAGRGGDVDSGTANSGIQARNALIEELEAKLKALNGKHQDAQGQLHARDVETAALRQEVLDWREKWESVTTSLDQQADNASTRDQEIGQLRRELDDMSRLHETVSAGAKSQELELTGLREAGQSLEARNQNLFETTELANRQIESLGQSLEELRVQLKEKAEELEAQSARFEPLASEIDGLKAQVASRDQDVEFLHGHVETKQNEINALSERLSEIDELKSTNTALTSEQEALKRSLEDADVERTALQQQVAELDAARAALTAAETALEQKSAELGERDEQVAGQQAALEEKQTAAREKEKEVERLEECVAQAHEANERREAERRQLSEQMNEAKRRSQHLEAQLAERSNLVVGLEQEKTAISDKTTSLEEENARLSEVLEKSQRHSAENADHIAQVDSRLERQKQLMENLEKEYAQVQQEFADAGKAHSHELNMRSAEVERLNELLDNDESDTLKDELSTLGTTLQETRTALQAAEQEAQRQQENAESISQDLEQRKTHEESARESINDKVEQLEKQLRKQTDTTLNLEQTLEQTRLELDAERSRATEHEPSEPEVENEVLQQEVIKLEGMVRERTEQLNKMRWQQEMADRQTGEEGSNEKMLVVLNQQLDTAREDNRRLLERIRDLESKPSAPPLAGPGADDLSKIRGVGPKLVEQLNELGIYSFDQIATLSDADLDDEEHVLHSLKGRILKDGWIEQAARLGG